MRNVNADALNVARKCADARVKQFTNGRKFNVCHSPYFPLKTRYNWLLICEAVRAVP